MFERQVAREVHANEGQDGAVEVAIPPANREDRRVVALEGLLGRLLANLEGQGVQREVVRAEDRQGKAFGGRREDFQVQARRVGPFTQHLAAVAGTIDGDGRDVVAVGGFFLLDVPTREAALEIAARCPAAEWATVEVRGVGPCFDDAQ